MQYKLLEKDNYLIFDKEREYGMFRLIPVLPPKPKYCKHMEMIIFQEVVESIVEDGDMRLLLRIFRFVFDSVLEITHELQGAKYCKLHSSDELIAMVYRRFSQELSKKHYEVKHYRGWIEIHKKA